MPPAGIMTGVLGRQHNLWLGASLVFAVFLWGANNTGTKFIVSSWPPIWTGASRFLCAGLLLAAFLRYFQGARADVRDRGLRRRLWIRGGLSLAAYIVVFNSAVQFTSVSHIALYLGAAPVWAVLWEGLPRFGSGSVRRYAAAGLACLGVAVLFGPAVRGGHGSWIGEILGLAASVLWTNYGRQCRGLTADLSGAWVTAATMWRAGVLLLPFALAEVLVRGVSWQLDVVLVQTYCVLGGSVVAFALWNRALQHWPASQVLLFNNLIPLSTMLWARALLKEPVSATFWIAMPLIIAGVLLGQTARAASPAGRLVAPQE